jgi:rhodanese-related sulfurtransferase
MELMLEFVTNHWGLSLAFVAISAALVASFVYPGIQGVRRLSPGDAIRLINHEDALVVDIRTEGEFREGHIVNAVHVTPKTVSEQSDKLDKYRSRPMIVACRSGHQSASVAAKLRKRGFEQVHNLQGGMLAWENASLPVSKK